MIIALAAFVRVALRFLTAVLFSMGRRLCTTFPTKWMEFPARFLIAWLLLTLLAHGVLRLRKWCGICGVGASSSTVWVGLPVLDKLRAGVALIAKSIRGHG